MPKHSPKPKQTRRHYPEEVKRQHLIAALASGNVTKYEAEHDLSPNIIFSWRRHLPGGVAPAPKIEKKPTPGVATHEEKRAHVAAAFAPGVSTRAYASLHGFNEQNLYSWFKQVHGVSRADARRREKAEKNGHAPQTKQLALVPEPVKRVPESAAAPMYTPVAHATNGERRLATPASLRAQVDKLRLENTVLKSVLRLAEMRGFRLWDTETDDSEEERTEQ